MDSLPSELGGNLKVDHGAWLRYCFKSMTNRVGDLCDISTGPEPLFHPSETTNSEADDRPEDDEEPISEAEPTDDEDEDVEEIEEPVPLQVESVAHRLVNCLFSHFVDLIVCQSV